MLRKAIILGLLVFAVGCGAKKAAVEDVQKAADLFFQRLNEANYEAIYKDASEDYKKMESLNSTKEHLTKVAPYGKGRSERPIKMPILENGKVVQPVYGVASEIGRGSITLTFIDEKGEWKLRSFELGER